MNITPKVWYAIYTKPRNEKKIAEMLQEKGIENYLPLIKRIKQWSDRRKNVEEPMFSSYIFVRIRENEHLPVLQTPGVIRFVMFERKKVPVRNFQIEAIRKYEKTGEEFIPNQEDFIPGKKVRIIKGGLKGLEGSLIEISGKQRVKIEVDAIGQSIYIKIPMGSLEITGEEERKQKNRYW